MVFITIVTGAYKPTYISGASHCREIMGNLWSDFQTQLYTNCYLGWFFQILEDGRWDEYDKKLNPEVILRVFWWSVNFLLAIPWGYRTNMICHSLTLKISLWFHGNFQAPSNCDFLLGNIIGLKDDDYDQYWWNAFTHMNMTILDLDNHNLSYYVTFNWNMISHDIFLIWQSYAIDISNIGHITL
jgi:hypothetical protein